VRIVADTNALLLLTTTDVVAELERLAGLVELVVPQSVLNELGGLAKNRGEPGRAAKLALKLAKAKGRAEPTDLPGDDGLLDVARRLSGAVFTNDRRIQAEAQKSGLKVIVARGPGRLSWMGAGSGSRAASDV
jgi:rRNA-processing protein FCF1